MIPFSNEPNPFDLGFKVESIGADGEVFGGYYGNMPELNPKMHSSAAVSWKNGNYFLYGFEDTIGPSWCTVARTDRGVLGYVPNWVRQSPTSRIGRGSLPVFFGAGANREPFFLPLPRGVDNALPTFANQSGNLILAIGVSTGGRMMPVIWRDDVPFVPVLGKQSVNAFLRSGTTDGNLAVGAIVTAGQANTAVIWENERGLRTLEDFARAKGILLPAGWKLVDAVSISPDGKRIFGTAATKKNVRRPFFLWLGERPRKPQGEGEKGSGSGDRT